MTRARPRRPAANGVPRAPGSAHVKTGRIAPRFPLAEVARRIARPPRIHRDYLPAILADLDFDFRLERIPSPPGFLWFNLLVNARRGQRRCALIAHRLLTVVDSDRIVVIDEGRVIGEGTHQQLVETVPLYRELAEHQLLV